MELLDIVDANDIVVDTRAMDDIYADGGPEALQLQGQTIRSVYLLLVNDAGELGIPRRAYHKKKFPGGLDFSACGHVSSGETYDEAFARETHEELGIHPSDHKVRVLGKLSPFDYPELHSMSMGYEIKLGEIPFVDPKEWHEWLWMDPNELLARLPSEPNSKGDLGWIVEHFYGTQEVVPESPPQISTLAFVFNTKDQILLAMKKRGFGAGNWNGAGGKVLSAESVIDGATRELTEETGLVIPTEKFEVSGLLHFRFPHEPKWNQDCHVYRSRQYTGPEPLESEEMNPNWFNIADIPYDQMWKDDVYWLDDLIKGKQFEWTFTMSESGEILDKKNHLISQS